MLSLMTIKQYAEGRSVCACRKTDTHEAFFSWIELSLKMKKNLLITLLSRTEGVLPLGRIQVSLKEKFCTDSIQVEVMQLSTCRKYLN